MRFSTGSNNLFRPFVANVYILLLTGKFVGLDFVIRELFFQQEKASYL